MREHMMIPDTQIKPGVPMDHLDWIGQYMVDKQPDVVVHIGDHWDFPSLSSYDAGKRSAEGRRIISDIEAGCEGWERLWKPLKDYNAKMRFQKGKQYRPECHFTEGNHEYRATIAAEIDAKLDGLIPDVKHLVERENVIYHPYKQMVEIDGIAYCHFFYQPNTGNPYTGMMETRIKNIGYSFTMGHQQGYKSAMIERGNGRVDRGLAAGSCYLHDEFYKGPQANNHWRGVMYKHEVFNGSYDLMEVSLDKLCRKYEGIPVSEFMQKKYPDIFYQSQWLQRLAQRREQLARAAR